MMDNKKVVAFVAGVLVAAGVVIALMYVRQRLFTQTEPIVLAS